MKKNIKHKFTHSDPEIPKIKSTKTSSKGKAVEAENNFALADLKKTLILIAIFVAVITAIYFTQTKTGLLGPVLKIFGL